jgi:hypothetical protein
MPKGTVAESPLMAQKGASKMIEKSGSILG